MSSHEEVAISVQGVSKAFKLPHERHGSIKNVLFSTLKGKKRTFEKQKVLNDISFEIKKGEFFGIVGRNGSSKSTLLKLLAGIYSPDRGHIQINGKLTPFIELGVGFNRELTGRENVFLNGALLGFSRSEMEKMYDEIVDFAELEKFMDQQLKNYSSGMQVRLAFSIAIRANTDILVLDEVLAVGDEAFQRKCDEYFASLKHNEKTVVLVTHNMSAVRKYCDKAMLIEKGKISVSGSPEDVANQYIIDNFDSEDSGIKRGKFPLGLSQLVPSIAIKPISKQVLTSKDVFEFEVYYEITEDIPVRFGISIIDENSGGSTSVIDDQIKDKRGKPIATSTKKGEYSFRYRIPLRRFNNRNFTITATLYKIVGSTPENIAYTAENRVGRFAIQGEEHDGGLLKEKGEWVS